MTKTVYHPLIKMFLVSAYLYHSFSGGVLLSNLILRGSLLTIPESIGWFLNTSQCLLLSTAVCVVFLVADC